MATDEIKHDLELELDLPYPIFVLTNEGEIVGWNNEMEQLTGVSAEDAIDRSDFPDGFSRTTKQLIAPVKRSGKTTNGSLTIENGEESPGEIELKLVPHEQDGHITACVISDYGKNGHRENGKDSGSNKFQDVITNVVELLYRDDHEDVSDKFKDIVRILPQVLRHPDDGIGFFMYDGEDFKTDNFKRTRWKIDSKFETIDGKKGRLRLYYGNEHEDEEVFTDKEKECLETTADLLLSFLNQKNGKEVVAKNIRQKGEIDAYKEAVNEMCIVTETDKKGYITFTNDLQCEVAQYSREELVGANQNIVRHPDSPSSLFEEMWGTIGKGEKFRTFLKNQRKDGSPYYVDAVIVPVLGENGKPYKYIGVRYHITEMTLEKQRMEGIVNAIDRDFGFIEYSKDGHIQQINENYLDLIKYSEEEIKGKHDRVLVDEEYAQTEEFKEFWNKLENGESFSREFKEYDKNGDEVIIQGTYSPVKDDMGRIKKIVKIASDVTEQARLRNELQEASEEIKEVMSKMADGDLTTRVQKEYKGAFGKIKNSINLMADNISETLEYIESNSQMLSSQGSELTSTSQSMEAAAEETTSEAQSVAAAADQADRNFQSISSAAEQMSTSVQEIARVVRESDKSATNALNRSKKTSEIVKELSNSSKEIGSVVETITTIAQQTKILALNATIEAARAGEAGKGFTVVANEVKELARQTTESAEEIADKIGGVQENSDNVQDAIENVSVMVEQMNQNSENISSSVEEQSITIADITKNIKQAAKSVSEISKKINSVADAAGETAKGAANTNSAAEELQKVSIALNKMVDQFEIDSQDD